MACPVVSPVRHPHDNGTQALSKTQTWLRKKRALLIDESHPKMFLTGLLEIHFAQKSAQHIGLLGASKRKFFAIHIQGILATMHATASGNMEMDICAEGREETCCWREMLSLDSSVVQCILKNYTSRILKTSTVFILAGSFSGNLRGSVMICLGIYGFREIWVLVFMQTQT